MRRALRREGGFTMIELLLVCVLSLIVFGASLTAWTSIYRSNRALEGQQDNAEAARVALDRAARQLRNLANPSVNAITTIHRASDYDFIFQTSDPAKTWVRYCLEGAKLWENESVAITAAMKAETACPGTGWTRKAVVVQSVTNRAPSVDRNIFTYECAVNAAASCPTATEYSKITNVGIQLWVDADATDRVSELDVATGVYLRNQNEAPTASAGWSKIAKEQVLLNGSASTDPEGRTLEYFWFEDAVPSGAMSTPCTATPTGTAWSGVTFLKTFPTGAAGQSKQFFLLVRDPGCLTSLSAAINFTVPT